MNKRKEAVKTFAIIFFAALFILTFLSNTIMNYSLPEVSAQYPRNGTISEQIRGSGLVAASELYEVILDESRVIASVEVDKGDTVTKDQVLIKLEESESAELDEAKKALDAMKVEYEKALLQATGKDYSLENLEIKNLEEDIINLENERPNISKYQSEYDAAKEKTDDAEEQSDSAAKDQADLEKQAKKIADQLTALKSDDHLGLDKEYADKISAAEKNVENNENKKNTADEKVKEIEKKITDSGGGGSSLSSLRQQIEAKELEISRLNDSYINSLINIDSPNNNGGGDGTNAAATPDPADIQKNIENAQLELKYLRIQYSDAQSALSASSSLKGQLTSAQSAFTSAESSYDKSVKSLNDLKLQINKELNEKLTEATEEAEAAAEKAADAKEIYDEAAAAEEEAKAKQELTEEELDKQILEKTRNLEQKKATLKNTQSDDMTKQGLTSIDIETQRKGIEDQENLIEKLESKVTEPEIKAPVGGVIDSISFVAGETVKQGTTILQIQMSEKGYELSFDVTIEDAAKLVLGTKAELMYYWSGGVDAVLKAIKTSESDPQRKRTLVFNITGEITPGQTLNLSLGGKNENYATVVPKSAVREDNNGKFILSVVSRSSPLGNRYIAERIDIQELASDDSNVAVSGAITGNEFIITNATKPVEPGNQVKLAESN